MSLPWRKAVIKVLRHQKEAMHYADIADEVLEKGLRDEGGATPANTVNAVITKELNDKGEDSAFVRVGRGEYILRDFHGGGVVKNREIRNGTVSSDEENAESLSLVHAFGMYWQRELVNWSRTVPSLYGKQNRKAEAVDFSEQVGVYLLHDRRETIYVGRTTNQSLGERLKQHTYNRLNGRWDRFSWFGLLPVSDEGHIESGLNVDVDTKSLIKAMEALLIEALEPPQNRQRGEGFKAVEYLQAQDNELQKNDAKMMLLEMIQDRF